MKHLQVDLSERAHERLIRLTHITGRGRRGDVIADALRIYELAVDDTLAGGTVISRDPEGNEVPYRGII